MEVRIDCSTNGDTNLTRVLHISGGNLDTVYKFKGLLGEHVQIVSPEQLSSAQHRTVRRPADYSSTEMEDCTGPYRRRPTGTVVLRLAELDLSARITCNSI